MVEPPTAMEYTYVPFGGLRGCGAATARLLFIAGIAIAIRSAQAAHSRVEKDIVKISW